MRLTALFVVIASVGCSSGETSSPVPGDAGTDSATPIDSSVDSATPTESGTGANITGKWCSDLTRLAECGDDVPMLELVQTGASVTGKLCKKDCYPVTGTVSGSTFNLSYTAGGSRVDTTLTIAGDAMSGETEVSGMRYPVTFSRMP